MATSQRLHLLNAYPEFKTQAGIDEVFEYVDSINHLPPPRLSAAQKRKWTERYDQPYWEVEGDDLHYKPNADLDVVVVPPGDHERRLFEVYEDPTCGHGVGLHAFYRAVCSRYLSITRAETSAFLKRQGDYLLAHPRRKIVNKPILAQSANERWGIDLVDCGVWATPEANDGYRYILCCIDYFSRCLFAQPLRQKSDRAVATAFAGIIRRTQTSPHLVQSDGGGEFIGPQLGRLMQAHHIHHILTRSYSPTMNGLIERANRSLLARIKAGFIRFNDLEWASRLQDYVDGFNAARSRATRCTPNQLWTPGYNPRAADGPQLGADAVQTDAVDNAALAGIVRGRLARNAGAMMARNGGVDGGHQFLVGETVRVHLSALESRYRKAVKEDRTKQLAIHWSPPVYSIATVQPARPLIRERYTLSKPDGQVLRTSRRANAAPRVFFGSDLLPVPEGARDPGVETMAEAAVINRLR
jgi:hypothetical protein